LKTKMILQTQCLYLQLILYINMYSHNLSIIICVIKNKHEKFRKHWGFSSLSDWIFRNCIQIIMKDNKMKCML
jgi:hypothetical protein